MTEERVTPEEALQYERVVYGIANRIRHCCGPGVAWEDLVQEGRLGLLLAAERFDGTRGVDFPVYAAYWVRSACQRYVEKHRTTVRFPTHVHWARRALKKEADRLGVRLRDLDIPSAAKSCGMTEDRARNVIDVCTHGAYSLDEPIGDDGKPWVDALQDSGSYPPDAFASDKQESEVLQEALSQLSERHRNILVRKFVLEDRSTEIGKQYGISHQAIHQQIPKAVSAIKRALARAGYES